jgi:hypothetical protein
MESGILLHLGLVLRHAFRFPGLLRIHTFRTLTPAMTCGCFTRNVIFRHWEVRFLSPCGTHSSPRPRSCLARCAVNFFIDFIDLHAVLILFALLHPAVSPFWGFISSNGPICHLVSHMTFWRYHTSLLTALAIRPRWRSFAVLGFAKCSAVHLQSYPT